MLRGVCETLLFEEYVHIKPVERNRQWKKRPHTLNIYLSGIWRDTLTGKLFDKYYIKDELEVELDALLEEACDHRKATAHE